MLTVTKTVFGQEEVTEEQIEVQDFETTPAIVGCDIGFTVNLGSYNSARVSVSIKLPCYKEEIQETYDYARSFVRARLTTELEKLQELKLK